MSTDDEGLPEWSEKDLAALVGLPMSYEGHDDWIVTGRASNGAAVKIERPGDIAYIGPLTVQAGEARFLGAQPVQTIRDRVLGWGEGDALQETEHVLRRMRLVQGLEP